MLLSTGDLRFAGQIWLPQRYAIAMSLEAVPVPRNPFLVATLSFLADHVLQCCPSLPRVLL